MLDEPRRFARRTGFGIAVIGEHGQLVVYGYGRPPAWISTAAGAEAWAFCMVLSMTPAPPWVVTDCLEVCNTLAAGRQAATAGCKRLARVWVCIFTALDGDAAIASGRLSWMPAHGGTASIGRAAKLDGTVVTAVEWQAYRLVDALAKLVAAFDRVPPRILKEVAVASQLVEFSAALLGTVTECANNWKHEATHPDGTTFWKTVRDSAPPPRVARQRGPPVAPAPPPAVATAAVTARAPCVRRARSVPGHERKAKGVKLATVERWREEAQAAAGVSRWLAQTSLRPSEGLTATDRMQEVRRRIRERALSG